MVDGLDYDVVICGGGLAGLTLARQLKLELPNLSVAVIDRLTRPLPEAAFKVGESSIELGTYYLGQVLKLDKYFREQHLPKLGLRFFMGQSQEPIEARPETGPSLFPPVPSYQIDRGRLENYLRELVIEMSVELFEGMLVEDIELVEGDAKHIVKCRNKDTEENFLLKGRWVIDALGRRRLLQTKLGLKRTHGHQASAAWWRYNGRIDIENMVPKTNRKWHNGSVEDRYFSTNHLMNKGYWVWLIPLGSNTTSIGIVTDETIHPQNSYGQSYAQALEWLKQNEPALWEFLRNEEPLDFLSYKNYSYASAQVFSHQRWSCVGEAGFFLDPLYSVGSDMIATGNTLTVEMIRQDQAGKLTEETVGNFNKVVLDVLFPIFLNYYRGTYRTFGHPQIFTPKLAWDTALYWAFTYQLYAQGLILQPTEEVFALGQRYRELNARVQQLFIDWSEKAPPRPMHVIGDMTRMRFLMILHLDLATRRSKEQVLEVARKNLDRFEELAQVLFWQAVEECYPNREILKKRPWINAWKMQLTPEKWSEDDMFKPETAPRSLTSMRDNLTGIFAPQNLHDLLLYEFPYRLLHWGRGFVYYHIATLIRRLLFVNKPAMWVRKLLIKDYPSQPSPVR
ncbi:MAG: tryptophan 7-halogenase [Chloroflexota bacterium]